MQIQHPNASDMVNRQGTDAFFRIGIPMFILVTGGSFLLSQLLQGKFDIKASLSALLCACLVSALLTVHHLVMWPLQEAQGRATNLGLPPQTRASLEEELEVGMGAY